MTDNNMNVVRFSDHKQKNVQKLGKTRQGKLDTIKLKFETLEKQVLQFADDPDDLQKGLLCVGTSGVGKSMFIESALQQASKKLNAGRKVSYKKIEGGEVSGAGLYIKLYQEKGGPDEKRITWFDDTTNLIDDVTNLGILKTATNTSRKPRRVDWPKQPSPFMQKNKIESEMQFWGNIVISCNENIGNLLTRKKIEPHLRPILGRFTPIDVSLDKDQCFIWTNFMITGTYDILGANCENKKGGFSDEVIEDTLEFIKEYREQMFEVTPRMAVKIAGIRHLNPIDWVDLAEQQTIGGWDKNGE